MIWKPHLTVATIVVRSERFLMVEEEINDVYVLNQPAGHLEDNETLIDAARRETLEETAWHVNIEGLVGLYRWRAPASGKTFVRVCFVGRALRHEENRSLDTGIIRALWMSAQELKKYKDNMRSPLVWQCILDCINKKHYPLDVIREL